MDAGTLHEAIAEVCPVDSVSVGKSNDRSTWSFRSSAGATQAQIDAGNNVIATIPLTTKSTVPAGDFIARWTNAEYLALQQKFTADIAANKIGNKKNWDIAIANSVVDMNKKKTQNLKSDIVTSGVLTQARADEIFS
jgi:hypothetical protein